MSSAREFQSVNALLKDLSSCAIRWSLNLESHLIWRVAGPGQAKNYYFLFE